MKEAVFEYIDFTNNEKREFWSNAKIVFDTNILLNLYEITKDSREALLNAMEDLKERLWIPHHVSREFMANRCRIIYNTCFNYEEVCNKRGAFVKEIAKLLRLNDEEKDSLKQAIDTWVENKRKRDLNITEPINSDYLVTKILELFEGRVGQEFPKEKLDQIEKDGKSRFAEKVPPGYMDDDKRSNKYGDLIIWKQTMEYAKNNNIDIIFVCGDVKEDWWNIRDKNPYVIIGPRPELRKEFSKETSQRVLIYSMSDFINGYDDYRDQTTSERVKEELKSLEKQPTHEAIVKGIIPVDDYEPDKQQDELNKFIYILDQAIDETKQQLARLDKNDAPYEYADLREELKRITEERTDAIADLSLLQVSKEYKSRWHSKIRHMRSSSN